MKKDLLLLPFVVGLFLLASGQNAQASGCSSLGTAPSACQFEVASRTVAPLPGASEGIKLDKGTATVLFKSYLGTIAPYYISNSNSSTSVDLFVPQRTSGEFQSFINLVEAANVSHVSLDYAVVPTTYTARPGVYRYCAFGPTAEDVRVPQSDTKETPLTREGYTLLEASYAMTPSSVKTTVYPPPFTQTRDECSRDNEGNRICNSATYTNAQTVDFVSQGTKPNYKWNTSSPTVSNTLTYTVNGGASNAIADCGTLHAPLLRGSCGPNNGADMVSAPTWGLCNSGDATGISPYYTAYGIQWGWTCNDVQGQIWPTENQPVASGPGCAACQDMSKYTIGGCSVSCGGGQQQVTWYDGCGKIELQYNQSCNTQPCCYSHAYTSTGGCSVGCGGGYQYVQWYNTCGQPEDGYWQSCNTHSCCSIPGEHSISGGTVYWCGALGVNVGVAINIINFQNTVSNQANSGDICGAANTRQQENDFVDWLNSTCCGSGMGGC